MNAMKAEVTQITSNSLPFSILATCPGEIMEASDETPTIKILAAEIIGDLLRGNDPDEVMVDELRTNMVEWVNSHSG